MKREHDTLALFRHLLDYLKGGRIRYLVGIFLFSDRPEDENQFPRIIL